MDRVLREQVVVIPPGSDILYQDGHLVAHFEGVRERIVTVERSMSEVRFRLVVEAEDHVWFASEPFGVFVPSYAVAMTDVKKDHLPVEETVRRILDNTYGLREEVTGVSYRGNREVSDELVEVVVRVTLEGRVDFPRKRWVPAEVAKQHILSGNPDQL